MEMSRPVGADEAIQQPNRKDRDERNTEIDELQGTWARSQAPDKRSGHSVRRMYDDR